MLTFGVPLVIAGEGTLEPITAAENASTNCWPVQPKWRDLTVVAKFNSTVGMNLDCCVVEM